MFCVWARHWSNVEPNHTGIHPLICAVKTACIQEIHSMVVYEARPCENTRATKIHTTYELQNVPHIQQNAVRAPSNVFGARGYQNGMDRIRQRQLQGWRKKTEGGNSLCMPAQYRPLNCSKASSQLTQYPLRAICLAASSFAALFDGPRPVKTSSLSSLSAQLGE